MNETITIERRFHGPPESGNGGYVCGRIAQFINGTAEVALRHPPPLEQPLTVERLPDDRVILRKDDTLIAEARPASLELRPPAPPTYAEAQAASRHYGGFKNHPYPTCFVCGPARAEGDGLHIFAGPVPGRNYIATPWHPDPSLADEAGFIRPEFMWAVLDCPGGVAALGSEPRPILLGQLTATLTGRIKLGERCIVIGWSIARNGRKHVSGTALFSETGDLYGHAQAIWIEPRS